jgi:hypothetical protein
LHCACAPVPLTPYAVARGDRFSRGVKRRGAMEASGRDGHPTQ